nr:MAG TPA: hypothetical protein [Caudoviricetes sp.]
MIQTTLKIDFAENKFSDVKAMVERLRVLVKSNYGVLSGDMLWLTILQHLGVDTKKEILDTFYLCDLKSKIYGIETLKLIGVNTATNSAYLMFEIGGMLPKECGTDCVAKDISDIYAYVNKIETNSQLKANVEITTDGASVNFPKDDPVAHDIVNNIFDSVRAVYKGLNKIKSETGVKTGVVITGLGIHFDSVKDKFGFSISVEKKELDNAADMRMPIKNTIDIAIKKVIE